jgi:CHAT domain-containing protein/tetratricopeptide (TPR) repeat protein
MMMARCTALVLSLLVSAISPTAAHIVQVDTNRAEAVPRLDAQLAGAEAAFAKRNYEEAERLYRAALADATAAGLDGQRARALLGVARILYANRQTRASEEPAREALAIFDRLGLREGVARTSHLLSLILESTGSIAEARTLAERAVQAFDNSPDLRGRLRASLQLIDLSNLTLDQQLLRIERLADEAGAAGDVGMEAILRHGIGDRLFGGGRLDESLGIYTRAAALFRQANDEASLGAVYNSLGRLYRAHGRYEEALKFQQDALALHEKSGSAYYHVQSLNAVAVVEGLLGHVERSREYFERALVVAEQRMRSTETRDFLRANIAGLLIDEGHYAEAASALEAVLASGPTSFQSTRYSQLAHAYLGMGKPREALDAAERSIAHCGESRDRCADARGERARAHAALGDLPPALADIDSALADLDAVRARLVPTDFFKQNFPRVYERSYGIAVALQFQAGRPAHGLEAAERGRARALLDLLASRNLQAKAASPASLQRLEATAARLTSTILSYWVTDEEVFIWVVSADGLVQSRRVPVLRSKLESLVRDSGPFARDAAPPPSTSVTLGTRGAMRVALARPDGNAWRALYGLLIAPVRDALPRTPGALLTIVPHGPLQNLSFAALQDTRGRYLLEDYALHYAPAGALLDFTASRRRPDSRKGPLLLVADPTPPRLSDLERPLPRLPGARSEARAIGRLLPRPQVTTLEDAGATEENIRRNAPARAVLHFATHAIVRDNDPFVSYLALGRSAEARDGDGLLTAEEIYSLNLDADLVVLSACRSGGGTVKGDGVSTFARAFTYAGTASVVASLWDVADEPTNRLLPGFYRAWLDGAAKAQALRRAQLTLLADLRASRVHLSTPAGSVSLPEHPVFWAGFALFGEPD